jgi:hypothetical protein
VASNIKLSELPPGFDAETFDADTFDEAANEMMRSARPLRNW